MPPPAASVTADLESIRGLFNEKEKELSMAVQKVDELTHQLEELRRGSTAISGNHSNSQQRYPPQLVELERLRRELAYRKQLNEQQNNMIAQQRAQLSMGKEEMGKIDERIVELQDRLARKRMMNQQLANQISAATSAKQAPLRAIQQGMMINAGSTGSAGINNKTGINNKNKPVSTVEPFQRNHQAAPIVTGSGVSGSVSNISTSGSGTGSHHLFKDSDVTGKISSMEDVQTAAATSTSQQLQQQQQQQQQQLHGTNKNNDPKYQTLPFNTKFNSATAAAAAAAAASTSSSSSAKIEALKQEKENNNVQFASDLT